MRDPWYCRDSQLCDHLVCIYTEVHDSTPYAFAPDVTRPSDASSDSETDKPATTKTQKHGPFDVERGSQSIVIAELPTSSLNVKHPRAYCACMVP